ncbi:hypothetical protein [Schlesneria paludicola]|uniref:hypothetical protein n=1 Tax=Schlesneria paludicola TaxID=360056 RepID=UPI0012FAC505|nr:hypothetical protein [Schlesneria paludicola]
MPTCDSILRVCAGLVVCSFVFTTVGCELNTGANLKAAVRFKPSKVGEAAAESETPAETTTEVTVTDGVGTLKGKVEYNGAFTPLPPLYAKGADVKDAAVCAAAEAPNETIIVKDGGLANVFIYLRKAPKITGDAAPAGNLIFDQKNCVFKPHAMIVPVGKEIRVLNSDGVAHNTHTNAKKNTDFNKIVNPHDSVGAPLIYKQAEQEPFSVVCDIHSWMRAYHLPIDHPFATISAEDGTFEIQNLPAGKHEFKVWHEAGGLLEKALVVTIKPGENDPLTIKVSPSQLGK